MFHVTIEEEARQNIRAHFSNLQQENPGSDYPWQWFHGISEAILDLSHSAERCGTAYEDKFFQEGIRQRLFHSYKILFTIRDGVVHVLHIRHQAQDSANLR